MIDTHIHLADEQYSDDVDEIIKNFVADGNQLMIIGCEECHFKKVIELANKYEVYGAIGFHPIEFENVCEEQLIELKNIISSEDRIIALGEIGLDYYWYPENKEEQKVLFEKQLNIAEELNIPVVIHARDALDDTLDILKQHPKITGVIHSFAGDSEMAKKFIDIGFLIGITGPITFKNGYSQRDVAANINLENIIIETDGPYLTPVPFRGKRNEPQYIEYIAEAIATEANTTTDYVLKQTEINFISKFLKEKNDN